MGGGGGLPTMATTSVNMVSPVSDTEVGARFWISHFLPRRTSIRRSPDYRAASISLEIICIPTIALDHTTRGAYIHAMRACVCVCVVLCARDVKEVSRSYLRYA